MPFSLIEDEEAVEEKGTGVKGGIGGLDREKEVGGTYLVQLRGCLKPGTAAHVNFY